MNNIVPQPTEKLRRPGWAPAILVCLCITPITTRPLAAEDGYDLWLRYRPVQEPIRVQEYRRTAAALVVQGTTATDRIIREELRRGLRGMLGVEVPEAGTVRAGAVIVGTPSSSPLVARLGWGRELASLGREGYVIRSTSLYGQPVTVIAAEGVVGALYGSFHFLRLIQTRHPVAKLAISQTPRVKRRLLNHWDNIDGSIERGYAGASLWRWSELPDRVDPRVTDYARANASLGINGTVLNNVNANSTFLSHDYLLKVAALADVFRPFGIRVYLSANPAAPRILGKLKTADPLDPAVNQWWNQKADEIYQLVPDFGGFLVKANSEGQPGPQDYGRTHADGANALAAALAPHGGVVMWRAFVYSETVDPDRVKRAYTEFVPLDGKFRENTFVQVKNGPLDFQPREPFHPLFGAMPATPLTAELQITQEYLGQSTHAVFLAPMWKEFLDTDTHARGEGSLVAKVIDGSLHGLALSAIAGVANTGSDRNWCGHDLAQANWYAYGRLAWDHRLTPENIADEWIRMTWSNDSGVVAAIRSLLLATWETYIDYTMPLGLHHLIGGDHYVPMPENTDPRRADWSATFYHRADREGLGYDRTRGGSKAVDQYFPPLPEYWDNLATCPDKFLLWFHHLPWDYKMRSGRTLWGELCFRYRDGAARATELESAWRKLEGRVDEERFRAVAAKMKKQSADAAVWSEKCLRYFQSFSGKPIAWGRSSFPPDALR
jgi:alpha-glucuronidase